MVPSLCFFHEKCHEEDRQTRAANLSFPSMNQILSRKELVTFLQYFYGPRRYCLQCHLSRSKFYWCKTSTFPASKSPCWLNARFWSGPIYSRVASPASAKHLVATDLLPKRPGYYSAGEQPGEQFGKYSALKRSHHLCLSCILTKNKRVTGDAALLSAAQAL